MGRENIEAVRFGYEVAFAQRSAERLPELLAEGFTWHQRPEWPGRSVYTAADWPQLWAELDDTYSELSIVPVDLFESGEYVIVTVETSARMRTSDDRIAVTQWHVWRMRDGLALEARAYSTREDALKFAGLE